MKITTKAATPMAMTMKRKKKQYKEKAGLERTCIMKFWATQRT